MVSLDSLTDKEILELADAKGLYDEELNKEWFRRHRMNFPYRLTFRKEVLNCLSLRIVKDSECDKLILEQAKILRGTSMEFY